MGERRTMTLAPVEYLRYHPDVEVIRDCGRNGVAGAHGVPSRPAVVPSPWQTGGPITLASDSPGMIP